MQTNAMKTRMSERFCEWFLTRDDDTKMVLVALATVAVVPGIAAAMVLVWNLIRY